MTRASIAAALLLGAATTASAQTDALPLVRDMPVSQGYDRPVDIIGVRFGEMKDDAMAALQKAYPESKPELQAMTVGINDARGNGIRVRYEHAIVLQSVTPDSIESVRLNLTSALTGSRVFAITRTVRFPAGKFGDVAALRASIKEKYGEPTVIERADHQNSLQIIYTYEKRPVKRLGEIDIRSRPVGAPNQCFLLYHNATNFGQQYKIFAPGERQHQGEQHLCLGTLRFTMFYGGNLNTFREMTVEAIDFQRGWADVTLRDEVFTRMVEEKARAVQGTSKPRL